MGWLVNRWSHGQMIKSTGSTMRWRSSTSSACTSTRDTSRGGRAAAVGRADLCGVAVGAAVYRLAGPANQVTDRGRTWYGWPTTRKQTCADVGLPGRSWRDVSDKVHLGGDGSVGVGPAVAGWGWIACAVAWLPFCAHEATSSSELAARRGRARRQGSNFRCAAVPGVAGGDRERHQVPRKTSSQSSSPAELAPGVV